MDSGRGIKKAWQQFPVKEWSDVEGGSAETPGFQSFYTYHRHHRIGPLARIFPNHRNPASVNDFCFRREFLEA